MDNLKKKGFIALAWDFGGKFANLGVKFIISIFLTRLLEPEEFGLLAMVNVIVGMAMIFTSMGLSSSLIQRKHLLPVHYNSVFYFNLIIAIILTILLFYSSDLVAHFYNRSELINITKALSFLFIINATVTVQNTILRKELKNELLTKSRFFAAIVSGIIGISLAYYGFGVWALVYQTILNGIFYAIIIWTLSNWKPLLQFSFKALQQLWGFGFRIFISGLINSIYTQLDVLFIGKLFTPELLGFFQRAKSLNQMVVTFSSGSLMSILFPVLSAVQNDTTRFNNIVDKGYKVINWVVFFIIGLLFLTSRDIYIILFTEKWLPSLPYFRILLATAFVYPLSALLVNILGSKGNSKAFLRLEIIKKILVTFSFAAFFVGGIWGYLIARAIISVIALIINMVFASKEINVKLPFFINPLVINLGLMLVIAIPMFYFINIENVYFHLIIMSIAFSSIYIASSYLLKISGFEFLLNEIENRKLKAN